MAHRIISNEAGGEVWYSVKEHEERLEITRSGKVRSKNRVVASRYRSTREISSRNLKPFLYNGYWAVQIRVGGKRKNILVHRMVADLFVPNPEEKPYVNHLDGKKTNNAPENLEWCTHAENMRHARDTGLIPPSRIGPGEKSPAAKLDWETVGYIRTLLKRGDTHLSLATRFGVSKGTIGCIARNETWRIAV